MFSFMETQREEAFWNAVSRGDVPAVRNGLRTGLNANQLRRQDCWNQTPLQAACFDGRVQVVRVLIQEAAADVQSTDFWGRTALYVVLLRSAPDNGAAPDTEAMVRLLLENHADPNAVDSTTGETPLHHAKSAGVAQMLLDAGANVQTRDRRGLTPLHTACLEFRCEVVEALLNALAGGAENAIHWPCSEEYDWKTPFQWATHANSANARQLFRILYPFTADSALLLAIKDIRVSEDVIRFIVQGFNPDLAAKTAEGDSPLHLARTPGIIRILLQGGADFEARNNNNETPLIKWASQRRLEIEMVHALTAAGADLTAVDSRGFTAFDRVRMDPLQSSRVLRHYPNVVFAREGLLSLHHIFQASSYSYIAAAGDDASFHPPLNHLRMNTPLGQLQMDQVVVLVQLLDTNHMIRRRDDNGSVPLHHACQTGAPYEILRLLLHLDAIADGGTAGREVGGGLATPRCRDHQGILPIHALMATNPAVGAVTLLLEANPASASLRALNGDFPLLVACESSASVDVIFELLVSYPDLVG